MDLKDEQAGGAGPVGTGDENASASNPMSQPNEGDRSATQDGQPPQDAPGVALASEPEVSEQTASAPALQDANGSTAQSAVTQRKRMKKMLMYIAGGVFSLFALVSVTQIILKDDRIGTLVSTQAKGVQFMRPEKWVEKSTQDGFTYFTENGADITNAEVAVVLGSQTAPVDYASLSESDKSRVKGAFTSRPEALSSSFANKDCEQPGGITNNEQQREGYDLAYIIEATCNKLKGRDTKGKVKVVFGWKGKSLQIFAVMADDQLWQQDHDKLDAILASAKPL